MRLHRFFIDEHLTDGDLRLTDIEILNQWKNVLKLSVGDQVELINENSSEALATIKLLTKKEAVVAIEKVTGFVEEKDGCTVVLYCAILKKDNFESNLFHFLTKNFKLKIFQQLNSTIFLN